MTKFKAKPEKTNNKYESKVVITEVVTKDDDDGFCAIEGDLIEHVIYISGKNSFNRAKLLCKAINDN